MKKILIISAVFPPEPVVSAKLSYDIVKEISKTRDTIVIAPTPTRPLGFVFKNNVYSPSFTIINTKSYTCAKSSIWGRFRESYSFGKHCYKEIKKNHTQIQTIYCNTWPLFAQYYVIKASKKYNIKTIIHIQDVYPESLLNKLIYGRKLLKSILLLIDRYNLNNADKIIAISEKMKKYLIETRKIKENKIYAVQNWQNEEEFQKTSYSKNKNKTNKYFTFMYLGNIGPVAGIDNIINAFNDAKIENSRLIIAGSGSMKEKLEEMVKTLGNNFIEFWNVPDGKVSKIQSQADIMLLPIRKGASSSSIPSKLPAYMFSQKAIIASSEGNSDISEAIRNANCGWIVPPENNILLTKCMKEVSKISKNVLEKKGENGFYYAMENYSKKNNLPRIIQLINSFDK